MIAVLLAQAQAPGSPGPLGFLIQFLPFILVFVIFYFLLIRPQSQRQKALQEMIRNLKRGDRVVTSGGIHGDVVDLKEDSAILKVADNVKIEFSKQSIVAVRTKDAS